MNRTLRPLLPLLLAALLPAVASAQAPTTPPRPVPPGAATRPRTVTGPRPPATAKPAAKPAAAAGGSGATTVIETDADDPNSLSYIDAALDIVLQDYAQRTKRIIIKAPNLPSPTISLQSIPGERLTDDEYLTAIKQVLAINGIFLEPDGEKYLRVLPSAEASKYGSETVAIKTDEEGNEIPLEPHTGYASRMFELKHIDLEEAKTVIDGFIRQGAQVQTFERTNSIRVTDATENLNRLAEIFAYIDKPIPAREEPNIIQIHYAKAADIKARLEEIVAGQEESSASNAKKKVPVTSNSGSPGVSAKPLPPGVTTPKRVGAAQPSVQAPSSVDSLVQDAERGIIRGSVQIIADERTNLLIIITRPENMVFFERVIKVLDVETAPDVTVEVFRLEHAVAEDVAKLLNDLIGESSKDDESVRTAGSGETGKSESLSEAASHRTAPANAAGPAKTMVGKLDKDNIKILADERSNALVVQAATADMEAIRQLIAKVDIMLSQVVIESVIVEVTFNNTDKSGIDWVQRALNVVNEQGGEAKWTFATAGGGGTLTPNSASSLDTVSAFTGTSGINGWFTIHDLNLDMVVQFIQTDSQARLMSSPRITTMDNKEAVIESTQRIYWSEGSTRYSSSDYYSDNIKNEDVGIKITLTPRINKKGYIILTIEEEQQAVSGYQPITTNGRTSEFPNLTTRKMGADVAVQSGDTIVLGGLAENSTSLKKTKIPILGDIPLLGWLFRSESEERTRTEVLIFVTPYVVDTPQQIEDDARNSKASLDTEGVWDPTWSASRLADPAPEKVHKKVLENGRQTVLPPRYPLTRELEPLNAEYGLVPESPESPEPPATPETPAVPEVPEAPETPETPETPAVPEVPGAPEPPSP